MTFQFDPELVQVDIVSPTRDDALREVARPLVEQGCVGPTYPDLVCERERNYPTGLPTRGASVALAHADANGGVKGNHVAGGGLRSPGPFANMEDADEELPVRIIFILAMESAHAHLEMLTCMMRLIRDEELLSSLLHLETGDEVCHALNEHITP